MKAPLLRESACTQMPDSFVPFVSLTVPVMDPPSVRNAVIPDVVFPLVTVTSLGSLSGSHGEPRREQNGSTKTRYLPVARLGRRNVPSARTLWKLSNKFWPPVPCATMHRPRKDGCGLTWLRTRPVIIAPVPSMASICVTSWCAAICSAVALAMDPAAFHNCGA